MQQVVFTRNVSARGGGLHWLSQDLCWICNPIFVSVDLQQNTMPHAVGGQCDTALVLNLRGWAVCWFAVKHKQCKSKRKVMSCSEILLYLIISSTC